MGIGRINQNILSTANVAAAERVADTYYPHPSALVAWVHILSDDAGTLDVDVLLSDGSWAQAQVQGVAASMLTVVKFDYIPVAIRCRWTAAAAVGVVLIGAGYSGGPVS